jgi:polar amino acid transport system substrate-binding protein
MTTSRRHFQLGLATIALLSSLSAHAQTALDDVMKAKKITIAIPTDFPPYGFVGTDLKPQGLDVDMANYIAAKLGVAIELAPVTSANRIAYLQSKKADLVISTLGKNPEREKVIDFTSAYSPFFQAVFAPKSLAIKSFADLSGKSVGVTRGAIEDQAGPRRCRHQALRRQQRDRLVLRLRPGAGNCHGRLGSRQPDGQEPAVGHRIQTAVERLSQLHRRGQR